MARTRIRAKVHLFACAVTFAGAYALGASPLCSLAVGLCAPAVVVVASRFLLGTIVGARSAGVSESGVPGVALMSGVQFEDYVAQVARSCGLPVIMTPATGDWGVDLIVGRRPHRLAIQCKRRSRPVGPGAIQEVVAGAPMQQCAKTMVVSNQPFTPAAQQLAELHGCELVGGSDLRQLRATIRRLACPREVS